MTQPANDAAHLEWRRQDWIQRVTSLVSQIKGWSEAEGWAVEPDTKTLQEQLIETYTVPSLRVHLQGGDLFVNPIGLYIIGGNGRVDLEAIPTLSRVKLIGIENGWKIVTDSNVPLRVPWNQETFTQLAHDLLS